MKISSLFNIFQNWGTLLCFTRFWTADWEIRPLIFQNHVRCMAYEKLSKSDRPPFDRNFHPHCGSHGIKFDSRWFYYDLHCHRLSWRIHQRRPDSKSIILRHWPDCQPVPMVILSSLGIFYLTFTKLRFLIKILLLSQGTAGEFFLSLNRFWCRFPWFWPGGTSGPQRRRGASPGCAAGPPGGT